MLLSWVSLSVLLSLSAGAEAPRPIKLAAPGLQIAAKLPKEMAAFCTDHVSQRLSSKGMRVITSSEIGAMLGLERQKQLLGCSATAGSCMAELADALGADASLLGSIGQFGGVFVVNLQVIQTPSLAVIASYSGKARGEEELLDVLNAGADAVATQMLAALRPAVKPPDAPLATSAPTKPPANLTVVAPPESTAEPVQAQSAVGPWVTLGAGAALVVTGGVLLGLAASQVDGIKAGKDASTALTEEHVGTWLAVGGGLAVVGGVVWKLVSGTPSPSPVSLLVSPHGAGLVVGGAL
jgi:hypothetical protein